MSEPEEEEKQEEEEEEEEEVEEEFVFPADLRLFNDAGFTPAR